LKDVDIVLDWDTTACNIGKISLTGLCDLCGAFSLDR